MHENIEFTVLFFYSAPFVARHFSSGEGKCKSLCQESLCLGAPLRLGVWPAGGAK